MRQNELKLAPEKTEALVIWGHGYREKRLETRFKLGEATIKPKTEVKYLGITLDDLGTYGKHIENVSRKAKSKIRTLSKLMPNIGGPTSKKGSCLVT